MKRIYANQIADNKYIPNWRDSGGRNADLLFDTEKEQGQRKYFVPDIDHAANTFGTGTL